MKDVKTERYVLDKIETIDLDGRSKASKLVDKLSRNKKFYQGMKNQANLAMQKISDALNNEVIPELTSDELLIVKAWMIAQHTLCFAKIQEDRMTANQSSIKTLEWTEMNENMKGVKKYERKRNGYRQNVCIGYDRRR